MAGSRAVEKVKQMKGSAKNMSALEIAALGKNLAQGGANTALEMDASDKDWNIMVNRAKSGGPGSWFASKVDFELNGAHFLGKVGYSVEAGVVPLFDGAALDLQGADLKSVKTSKADPDPRLGSPMAYKNWITGEGGMLVLAPVGADNVVPMPVEDLVITEKGLTAKSEKSVDFNVGNTTVHGDRLEFCTDVGVLYNVRVSEDGVEKPGKYREEAAISGEGISIIKNPDYIDGEEIIDEITEEASNDGKEESPIRIGTAKDADSEGGIGLDADLVNGNISFGYTVEKIKSEKDPIWDQLADATKTEVTNIILNVVTTTFKSDNKWEDVKKIFEKKWDQVKAVYDGFTAEELKENWAKLPDQLKEMFKNKLTSEKDVKAYFEKLLPSGEIKELLGIKEDKKTNGEKKADGSLDISLAKIPLFPPILFFGVKLIPRYQFGPYIRAGVDNLYELWKEGDDKATELKFRAGVSASMSLRAAAMLDASALIVAGFGSLFAEAALKGGGVSPSKGASLANDLKFMNDAALEGRAVMPIKKEPDGSITQAGDVELELLGGFKLEGSVGANVGVKSSLLMWEKTLWEKKFASWDLLALALNLSLSKKKSDGIFSGWHMNEASIRIEGPGEGIGQAFLERNTADRRYGLYEPDNERSSEYDDINTNFMTALKLLKDYASEGEGSSKALVIPKNEENSGLADTVNQMLELQKQFLCIWIDAQNELEAMDRYLAELEETGSEDRERKDINKSIEAHTQRIAYLKNWKEESDGDAVDYYRRHSSNAGNGYLKALKAQAKAEATGYEALVKYERARYEDKTKKYDGRIKLIEDMLKAGKSEEEIKKAYEGKEVYSNLAVFEDTESLLAYENQRLEETTKDAVKRKTEVFALSENEKVDTAFYQKYASRLKEDDLLRYGNRDMLLKYEEQAFKRNFKKNKNDMSDYMDIEGLKATAQITSESEERLVNQFRNKKKGKAANIPKISAIFGKEFYRTATAEDLLELELALTRGEEGRILAEYLENKNNASSKPQADPAITNELDLVFGKKKKTAMERFTGVLENNELRDLIPYLTIEGLLEYTREIQKKAKTQDEKTIIAEEIRYLYRGLVKIESTSPNARRGAEEEYIAGYFNRFGRAGDKYVNALKKEEAINLQVMLNVFSDTSDNQRYNQLQNAVKQEMPDYKVLKEYLSNGGDKKAINEHMLAKESETNFGLADISRYYESRLSEETGHFERYRILKNLYENGSSYEDILLKYKEIGGGKGFSKFIRDEIKKGSLDGTPLSRDMIKAFEEEVLAEAGSKHRSRIELINSGKAKNSSYQEILKAYQDQVKDQRSGVIASTKKVMEKIKITEFRNGFEKSLKDKKDSLRSEQLIRYEQIKKTEAGFGHAERLRALLDLSPDADNFMTAPLVTDAEKKEKIRQEYLKKTNKFKKSKAVKKLTEQRTDELLSRSNQDMMGSILSYEQERENFYKSRLQAVADRRREIEEMRKKMYNTTQLCHIITNNLSDIKKNPSNIFARISEFEQAARFTEENKKSIDSVAQSKASVIARSEEAAKRMDEARKVSIE